MPTYDLSHPIRTGMQTYPGDPSVTVEPHATFAADGYRVTAVSMGSHAGTHVDAPSHTEAGGASLASVPLETFRFDAELVDVDADARESLSPAQLPASTDADMLVVRTGWDAHWGTDRYLDHPYLTPEAAEWCATRGVHVGVDALSVDPTPSPNAGDEERTGFDAHHVLLGSGSLVVENLRGLDALPRRRFELHAYPLALDGEGDGAPVRAVALVEER